MEATARVKKMNVRLLNLRFLLLLNTIWIYNIMMILNGTKGFQRIKQQRYFSFHIDEHFIQRNYNNKQICNIKG